MKRDERVMELVYEELRKAEEEHPGWPDDPVDGVAIIVEEVGSAMKEALELKFDKLATRKDHQKRLIKETAQVAAMGIRLLLNLTRVERQ